MCKINLLFERNSPRVGWEYFTSKWCCLFLQVCKMNFKILNLALLGVKDLNNNSSSLAVSLQHYKVFSTCPGCYNKLTPQLTDKTTIKFPNLQRGQTYTFSVQAGTAYGAGQNSTTSATISLFFGQVVNLRQSILNNTVTLQWGAPTDVDAKHIKVPSVVP